MHPTAHMSTAGVYCCPRMISGATYAGEPHCAPEFPRDALFIFLASPKSAMRSERRFPFGQDQVFKLQVPVRDVMRVHVHQTGQELFHDQRRVLLAIRPEVHHCFKQPPQRNSMSTYTCLGVW